MLLNHTHFKTRFMKKILIAVVALGFMLTGMQSHACTNYLVTKGASTDGSTMITYAADSHVLYGELYHWEAGEHPAGTMMDISNGTPANSWEKLNRRHAPIMLWVI